MKNLFHRHSFDRLRTGSECSAEGSLLLRFFGSLDLRMTILIVLFFTLIFFKAGNVVFAIENGKISIYPTNFSETNPKTRSWFIYNVSPGQTQHSEVTIQNRGLEPQILEIYAVDASANKDGAFTLAEKGTKEDVGGWVTLSQKTISLPANSKISIPFSLIVPVLASPGDHVGGITVEETNSTELSASGVRLVKRLGVRIYATVSGQTFEGLEIKDVKLVNIKGDSYLQYTLKNTGNTNVSLTGRAELKSVLGAYSVNVGSMGEVLAGREVTGKVKLDNVKPLSYLAGINIKYGNNNSASKFTPIKSTFLLFALFILVFAAAIAFAFSKRRIK